MSPGNFRAVGKSSHIVGAADTPPQPPQSGSMDRLRTADRSPHVKREPHLATSGAKKIDRASSAKSLKQSEKQLTPANSPPSTNPPPTKAWEEFHSQLNAIGDYNPIRVKTRQQREIGGSTEFQAVMAELFQSKQRERQATPCDRQARGMQEGGSNINPYTLRFLGKVKTNRRALNQGKEPAKRETKTNSRVVENAQRGWRILRAHVRDMAFQRRLSRPKLNWDILNYTMHEMTHWERRRYELYQRYGVVPKVMEDGTVVKENTMLSDKLKSAMAGQADRPEIKPRNSKNSSNVSNRRRLYKSYSWHT
ncbi:uncharacterized protein LOC131928295 [Physella acuta]|uniref:uncharacterized protein LOC131928295 n=1 Tax=Physella acuta TaxID=109671 RepID=UPI0027DBEA30|nr:uncharacterized protein LOC131928295 [Physella acuta]